MCSVCVVYVCVSVVCYVHICVCVYVCIFYYIIYTTNDLSKSWQSCTKCDPKKVLGKKWTKNSINIKEKATKCAVFFCVYVVQCTLRYLLYNYIMLFVAI